MSLPVTAYVIPPEEITDGTLLACNVPEPDSSKGEVIWDATKNYAIGDVVIRTQTHKRYKALVAGVSATPPESSLIASGSTPARWLQLGATHRWSMFDRVIGTQTIDPGGHLTVDIAPGPSDGIALLELLGQRVKITVFESQAANAAIAKIIDVNIDGSIIDDVFDFFFAEYQQQRNFVSIDLPSGYWNTRVRVEIFGSNGAGVGVLAVGRLLPIGATLMGAGVGIINYGKVNSDEFGNREWVEGSFARRITLPIVADRDDLSRIDRQLSSLRSKPAIYIGSVQKQLETFVCYGVYKDLYITVPNYPTVSMNLEIEGLNNI